MPMTTAIRYHVFDQRTVPMEELLLALRSDFVGYESLRQTLLHRTPKYGNDDDYADEVMRAVFEAYFRAVDGRPNTKGGRYHINLLPTTVHVYFGSVIGALPDGRKAGMPLSEGISPVQGADRRGPTAVLKSAAKCVQANSPMVLTFAPYPPSSIGCTGGRGRGWDGFCGGQRPPHSPSGHLFGSTGRERGVSCPDGFHPIADGICNQEAEHALRESDAPLPRPAGRHSRPGDRD